jgi:predicted ABC-type ATPase
VNPPEALILAGPNGAGKTTSSALLVPAGTRFLNSDVIAAQLLREGHPHDGIEVAAGRLILEQLRGVVANGAPFCIETNLAGRGLTRRIDDWRGRGYSIRLTFTALDSPELALRRVATRVSLGGHDVPEAVVRRRWVAGLRSLFDLYLPVVDRWVVFDSSDGSLRQIAEGGWEGPVHRIFDEERWTRLLRLATQAGASAARPGGELFDPVAPVHDDRNSEP